MAAELVIVGGGISGLALAHGLRSRGRPVTLLEADPRVGGTIRTTVQDGFVTEWGPNGFLDKEPATRALLAGLGLTGQLRAADPSARRRFLWTRGALREAPSSPPAFLKSNLLPLPARLRVLGELFSARAPAGADESLAAFGRRHLGREGAVLLDAAQTGIYAGDDEQLSAAAAFPQLAALEREHRSLIIGMVHAQRARKGASSELPGTLTSLAGGLETMVVALRRALAEAVHPASKATALSRVGDGWKLTVLSRGSTSTLEAGTVVLALPSFAAAELLRPTSPTLASELDGIGYVSIAAVHLGFRRSELASPPEGFGVIVPHRERRDVLGTIFVSSIFPWRAQGDRALFTCMVGGAHRAELVSLSDEALAARALAELRAMLAINAAPCYRQINRWPRGIPQYNLGHLARVRRIDDELAKLPGLVLTGNAYRGVGMNDCIRNAAELAARL